MMKIALTGVAILGLASPAMGQILPPRDVPSVTPTQQVTAASQETLADCQVWTDQLGELLEEADVSLSEDVREEAERSHEEAAQACDEGRYDEGIAEAREAVEMIEAEAETETDAEIEGDAAAEGEDEADTESEIEAETETEAETGTEAQD